MALTTPAVCWNTPCTPQKQPPAMTAVWMPFDACASTAGAGMMTASSDARDGATSKVEIPSAPIAAAQSDRRLNGWRDMGLPLGKSDVRIDSSLEGRLRFAIGAAHPVASRYAPRFGLLQSGAHEFVNKNRVFPGC